MQIKPVFIEVTAVQGVSLTNLEPKKTLININDIASVEKMSEGGGFGVRCVINLYHPADYTENAGNDEDDSIVSVRVRKLITVKESYESIEGVLKQIATVAYPANIK